MVGFQCRIHGLLGVNRNWDKLDIQDFRFVYLDFLVVLPVPRGIFSFQLSAIFVVQTFRRFFFKNQWLLNFNLERYNRATGYQAQMCTSRLCKMSYGILLDDIRYPGITCITCIAIASSARDIATLYLNCNCTRWLDKTSTKSTQNSGCVLAYRTVITNRPVYGGRKNTVKRVISRGLGQRNSGRSSKCCAFN